MKKIIKEHIIADERGTIKKTETSFSFKSEEPNYIKLYLKDIAYFYEVPKASSDLVYELFSHVSYNTHQIVLNMAVKKQIAAELGTTVSTIDNNLSKLVKKGILNRKDKGLFTLNPYLFGKGDWKTIKEMRDRDLHLEIIYDKETGERQLKGNVLDERTKRTPTYSLEISKTEY